MSIASHQPLPEPAQTKYEELVWRLGFLRTRAAEPDPEPAHDQILDWHKRLPVNPKPLLYYQAGNEAKTLNQHFSHLFPVQTSQFGQAFLEVNQRDNAGQFQTCPVCLNHDAFAAFLSDSGLGLDVVYFEPDMQIYYREPFLSIYKPVSPEKLQCLYRGLILRSASILKIAGAKLNLWAELRSDKNARLVVSRAKSVLAADSSFFSPTSCHTRIKGVELHERIARRFVDELLTSEPGNVLMIADAYAAFCRIVKEQNLEHLTRPKFKAMVAPMIKEHFDVCLRNDLQIQDRTGVRGWKNVGLVQVGPN